MAKIIYETREFTDRNTGVKTQYEYVAIAGTGEDSHDYEVALKNLVQSEKMALKMIYNLENKGGEISSRKATEDESPTVTRNDNQEDWLDELKK